MKTIISIIATLCVLSGFILLPEAPISKKERDFALSYLKDTKGELIKTVEKLNEKQLNWKSSDSTWSIAECIEHIAVSEDFIFGLSEKSLKESAPKGELAFTDMAFIQVVTDRSNKTQTQQPLEPINRYGSVGESIGAFSKSRDNHIEYLKKTQDDLRSSYFDFPFGKGDAYQVILLVGAHCERHIKQIKEIMSDPRFPK